MPTAGDQYKFIKTLGADGISTVYAGQEVTVREVVPADTPGAGTDTEDSVVVVFEEQGPQLNENGELVRGLNPRAVAIAASEFDTYCEAI